MALHVNYFWENMYVVKTISMERILVDALYNTRQQLAFLGSLEGAEPEHRSDGERRDWRPKPI